ncbi:SDR family oxidoreductase [Jatrophihabitans fulvus]
MATALITGVGRQRGLGAGIASALAADGWDLVVSYWRPYDQRLGLDGADQDPAEFAAALAASSGRRIEALPADLSTVDGPDDLVATARSRVGALHALVLSHCESVDSDTMTTTVESFDRHYAVNVRATWLLIRAFARELPSTGGAVVALTSDHTVDNLPYGATKGALDRVVLAAAHELGHRGLRANVLNPGPVDTGWMADELREQLVAAQPTGRLGTPEDIAAVVGFLLCDRGRWVNGQLLHANGGFPLGQLPV